MPKTNNKIITIGLTGGPCGGKSTAIAEIKISLEEKGYDVLVLPEAATHFLSSLGMEMGENQIDPVEFQEVLIPFQKSHEDMVHALAERYENDVVIILDRTILDSLAYIDVDLFDAISSPLGLSHKSILEEGRYDLVLHLVTAADGAEEFYTLKNNTARRESPQEAIAVDRKLQAVYAGLENFCIIDNSSDFAGKIQKAKDAIFLSLEN